MVEHKLVIIVVIKTGNRFSFSVTGHRHKTINVVEFLSAHIGLRLSLACALVEAHSLLAQSSRQSELIVGLGLPGRLGETCHVGEMSFFHTLYASELAPMKRQLFLSILQGR
jgi:hypothetical protein